MEQKTKIPPKMLAAGAAAALALTGVIVFFLQSGLKATTMSLMRTEGTVDVSNDKGSAVALRENLKLYSGYGVDTEPVSYAWIDLDKVKLVKMDQESEIELQKDGKDLEIVVHAGKLFFNVKEPLASDETMTIRTSTMAVGIRGTCGWVEDGGDEGAWLFLLEGKVEVGGAESGSSANVSAGEAAHVFVNAEGRTEITVRPYAEEYVPDFVQVELEEDSGLSTAVLTASGLDVLNPPDPAERLAAEFEAVIAEQPLRVYGLADGATGMYYMDLDRDGSEELIVLSQSQEAFEGAETNDGMYSSLAVYGNSMGHVVKYGEAEFNVSNYSEVTAGNYENAFNSFGFAEKDGKTYIKMGLGFYDDFGDLSFYGVEDGMLCLADYFEAGSIPGVDDDGPYSFYDWEALGYSRMSWDAMPENVCPQVSPAARELSDTLFGIPMNGYNYALTADLNHDDVEDLFAVRWYDRQSMWGSYSEHIVTTYIWDGSKVAMAQLRDFDDVFEVSRMALYREKTTGDLYLGYSGDTVGLSLTHVFVKLSDFTKTYYVIEDITYRGGREEHEAEALAYEQRIMAANAAAEAEMNSRFEQIQAINLSEWDQAAVAEAVQHLKEEYSRILNP